MTSPTQTTQIYQVFIKATPQAIWDAIVEPSWNSRYGYGGDGRFDLTSGGAYTCIATAEMQAAGMPEVVVSGEVRDVSAPHKLVQTWNAGWNGDPATTLTYEIAETAPGVCCLTVTHDLTGADETAAMVAGSVEGAGGGWAMVLSDLKTLLETGSGLYAKAAS